MARDFTDAQLRQVAEDVTAAWVGTATGRYTMVSSRRARYGGR
jgi:hypothetical protein